MTLHVNQQDTL